MLRISWSSPLPSWVARILRAILGPAERARVHELVVMVLVRVMTFRFILRRQLNRNRQCSEQSQSDDARPCFGIHIFLLVLFWETLCAPAMRYRPLRSEGARRAVPRGT